METLLRFLRIHCVLSLCFPTWGRTFRHSCAKLTRWKHEPMASWSTRYRSEYSKVGRALARMTQKPNGPTIPHGRIMTGTGTSGTTRCWSGTVALSGPGGIGAPGRKTGTALEMKHRQRVSKIMKKRRLSSQLPVLAWFFLQKSGLEARERNMILAATGNRYQHDLVEKAMKIQFPVIRYTTMTTALASTIATFWEAPSMRMTTSCVK